MFEFLKRSFLLIIAIAIFLTTITYPYTAFADYDGNGAWIIKYLRESGHGDGSEVNPYESRRFPAEFNKQQEKGIAQIKVINESTEQSVTSPTANSESILGTFDSIDAVIGDTFKVDNLSYERGQPIDETQLAIIKPGDNISYHPVRGTGDLNPGISNKLFDYEGTWTFSSYVATQNIDEWRNANSDNGNYSFPGRGVGTRYRNTYFKQYFSAVRVNVYQPQADFVIKYNGGTIRQPENSIGPVNKDSFSLNFNLVPDFSNIPNNVARDDKIKQYNWYYWNLNTVKWEYIGSTDNKDQPQLKNINNINVSDTYLFEENIDGGLAFKMEAINIFGEIACSSEHKVRATPIVPKNIVDFKIMLNNDNVTDKDIGEQQETFSNDFMLFPIVDDSNKYSQYDWYYYNTNGNWIACDTSITYNNLTPSKKNINNNNVNSTYFLTEDGLYFKMIAKANQGSDVESIHFVKGRPHRSEPPPLKKPRADFIFRDNVEANTDIQYHDVSVPPPGGVIVERIVTFMDDDYNEIETHTYDLSNEPIFKPSKPGFYYISLYVKADNGTSDSTIKALTCVPGSINDIDPSPDCFANSVIRAEWMRPQDRDSVTAYGGGGMDYLDAPVGILVHFEGRAIEKDKDWLGIPDEHIEEWCWQIGQYTYFATNPIYKNPPPRTMYSDGSGFIVRLSVKYNGKWSQKAEIAVTFKDIPLPYDPSPPTVKINIIERDEDPETDPSRIYPGESILFTVDTKENDKRDLPLTTNWELYKDGDIVEEGNGKYEGLKIYNYTEYLTGNYTVRQYVKNKFNQSAVASVDFAILDPKPPKISIGNSKDFKIDSIPGENIIYIDETLNIVAIITEENKSEEHPNGFGFKSRYRLRDMADDSIVGDYEGEGVGNSLYNVTHGLSTTISRPNLFPINDYTFNVYAELDNDYYRATHNITSWIAFKVENRTPTVTIEVTEGDMSFPLFAKEEVIYDITAIDLDGIIENVEIDLDNNPNYTINPNPNNPLYEFISKEIIQPIGSSIYKARLIFRGLGDTQPTLNVKAYDDLGYMGKDSKTVQVVKPYLTSKLNLIDEDKVRKKESRFLQFNDLGSETNSIYEIDKKKSVLQYKEAGEDFIQIPNVQNFEDENIRIYFPNYPNRDLLDTYFKSNKTFTLRLKVKDEMNFESDWTEKNIIIEKDREPFVDVGITCIKQRITEEYVLNNSDDSSVVKAENINRSYFKLVENAQSVDNDKLRYKIVSLIYDGNMTGNIGDDEIYTTYITENKDGHSPNKEVILDSNKNHAIQVQDITDFKITYLTPENALGNYYIKEEVREEIQQLPESKLHPLYNEILEREKFTVSDYIQTEILNIAPTLSFTVTKTREIDLIVQTDFNPSEDEKNKVDELIKELQNRGFKVNVIYEYNKF